MVPAACGSEIEEQKRDSPGGRFEQCTGLPQLGSVVAFLKPIVQRTEERVRVHLAAGIALQSGE